MSLESGTGSFGMLRAFVWSAFVLALVSANVYAEQVGSAFTYQGQLKDSGAPADGQYDLRFSLYDGGGTLVAGPIDRDDVLVVNGLFAVVLDFGSGVFDGDARFLQISVRRGDDEGSFSALTPRQELTPTPYAATAGKTVGVDGHSLDSEDGTIEDAVRVASSGRVHMTSGGLSLYDTAEHGVSFTTSGFSINAFPSEDPAYRYEAKNDRHRFFTGGGSTRMEINSSGNVGIGTAPTSATLTVDGDADILGTVEAADFAYGDSQQRTLTVLGTAFQPSKSGIEYDTGWGIWAEPTEQDAFFRVQVHLPDRAVVTGMSARVLDNSVNQNLRVVLCFLSLSNVGIGTMTGVESQGASTDKVLLTATEINNAVIYNSSRGYYLLFGSDDWESRMQLYYVTINYRVDAPD